MEQIPMTHQSIVRAINFLKAFIPYNQPMGTNEFSERFNLNKSTVSRILSVLRDNGLLYQDPDTKKYYLGPLAAEMGMAISKSLQTHLITIAQPFLEELSITTGEGIALEVLSGKSSILAYQMPTRKTLHVSVKLGERLPLHVTSGAKIILAFSGSEFVDKVLDKKLERFTPNTITDPEILKKHLVEYRRQGVAFDRGERDEDVYTIAAPIFNYEKRPVAAAVVVAPAKRMMDEAIQSKIITAVKETAQLISAKLYYPGITDKEVSQ
jgi:IclR family KDG regulon transcriptional repressor